MPDSCNQAGQSEGSGPQESAVFRYFVPGLLVGIVLGSIVGLYVGQRSGTVRIPETKVRSTGAPAQTPQADDREAPQPEGDQPPKSAPAPEAPTPEPPG